MNPRRFIAFVVLLLVATHVWAPPFGRRPPPPPHHSSSPTVREPPPHDFSTPANRDIPSANHKIDEGLFSPQPDLIEKFKSLDGSGTKDGAIQSLSDSQLAGAPATVHAKESNRPNYKPEAASEKSDALAEKVRAEVSIDETQERPTKLTVLINMDGKTSEQSVDIPQWEFFKIERAVVQRRMSKAFARVPHDAPIFFTALPPGMSTSDLLPGRTATRTFDNSPRFSQDHIRNFENIKSTKLRRENTRVFNFVGPPNGSSGKNNSRWEKLRALYDSAADRLGLTVGSNKAELLNSLSAGDLDVIVIVAHGDKNSIYLPDGSSVTVDDVLQLSPLTSDRRAPIVVLLSCETGSTAGRGMVTIAEALMLRGRASAVFAPTREVSAGTSTVRILEEFVNSASSGKFDDWVQRLRGPWQVIVDAFKQRSWPDDGFHREKSPG